MHTAKQRCGAPSRQPPHRIHHAVVDLRMIQRDALMLLFRALCVPCEPRRVRMRSMGYTAHVPATPAAMPLARLHSTTDISKEWDGMGWDGMVVWLADQGGGVPGRVPECAAAQRPRTARNVCKCTPISHNAADGEELCWHVPLPAGNVLWAARWQTHTRTPAVLRPDRCWRCSARSRGT